MKCEDCRLAAMSLADGETPSAPQAEIGAHLAACESCRKEMEQLGELKAIWAGMARRHYGVDLWPQIQGCLERPTRRWLAVLIVLLFIFKLADFIPDQDLGLPMQLVPVLIAATVFAALRQNPFYIQTELVVRENES